MLQLLLLGILLVIVFYALRGMLQSASAHAARKLRMAMVWVGVFVLLALAASGRLNWVVPLGGALIATAMRLGPLVMQLAPLLRRLLRRGQAQADENPPAPARGKMSRDEAYDLLGLARNATRDDILHAHRRLMQKLHPDRGGTDYLAAKLNQARDVLLGN